MRWLRAAHASLSARPPPGTVRVDRHPAVHAEPRPGVTRHRTVRPVRRTTRPRCCRRAPTSRRGLPPVFKIGDKAVHPAHGLGAITAIENREFNGAKGLYYILRILDNGMKVMVPTNAVTQAGLRERHGRR